MGRSPPQRGYQGSELLKMDPRVLLSALLGLIVCPPAASGSCPRPCACPQSAELHCTFRSLLSIPAVPKHVKHLNLGFNRINKITDQSLAGLRQLELLLLHGNDVHELPDGAFRELVSLQMLKMSYNKLQEVSRRSLQGLWSVARLHLDHNQLQFIHPDAFQGLTSLRLLQLEGNRLQQLHPQTFTTFTVNSHFHVSTLRHLYLSDNALMSLPARLLEAMPQLENLYLDRNPWTCDCSMSWFHDWDRTSPGVLKCKKDRTLPGGQLCPMCSSPRHLQTKDLLDVDNLVCSRPVISFPRRMTPEDAVSEDVATEDFKEPFGNISLSLSDEHGNEVDLECSVSRSGEPSRISWEQNSHLQLTSNISVTVELGCPVERDRYEKLWRLVAYYSSIPAHFQRSPTVGRDPAPAHSYTQASDGLYYTGVRANMTAQPAWLLQTSVGLQLNRPQSSARVMKLMMSANMSETVEAALMQTQSRSWVMIDSTNTTAKVFAAVLGQRSQMSCNVLSSGPAVIRWMLPDGSQVEAPYSSPDRRLSVSAGGGLVIKAVRHSDAGVYRCVAGSHGDFAALPFYLTVQEPPGPPPGDQTSITPNETFAGSPIFLPCTASGSPDAEITWILPSSSIVGLQATSPRAVVHPNGTLHIPQAQLSDSGYYKCIAINQHGVDTRTSKVSVIRRRGPMKPAAPQSASGVTQIRIPTENADEASRDTDGTQGGDPKSHPDPPRRRVPGGVAPSRRGIHPSRNIWRRPPQLQKAAGSRAAVRTNAADRRRISMSKSKIDPQKWAHILAKIRDRKAPATPPPTQPTAEDTAEASADDVTEVLGNLHTPVQYTHMTTTEQSARGEAAPVTPSSSSSHPPTEPRITQSSVEHNIDPHTSSQGVFFLPQTTTAPLQAATSPTYTEISAFSKAADWSELSETRDITDRFSVVAVSTKDIEASSRGHVIAADRPSGTVVSQSQSPTQSVAAASPTTTPVPLRWGGSERRSPPRLQQRNPRRRPGSQRRRTNQRKPKLVKPTPSVTISPAKGLLATVKTTAFTQLKIAPAASPRTVVPSTGSQAASSGRVSHGGSRVSRPEHEAASKPSSLPASPSETAKPPPKGSVTATSFPEKRTSQTVLGTSESPAPPELFSVPTSSPRHSPAPPVQPWTLDDLGPWTSDSLAVGAPNTTAQKGGADSQSGQPADGDVQVMETASGYASKDFPMTLSWDNLETDVDVTQTPTAPEDPYYSQNTASAESKTLRNPTEALLSATISAFRTSPSPTTLRVTLQPPPPTASLTGATEAPSLRTSTQGAPWTTHQQIKPNTDTSEPWRQLHVHPTAKSPDHKAAATDLSSRLGTQTAPPATGPEDGSRKQQVPEPESAPRAPRITTSRSQALTVNAGADAELPCEAEGDPQLLLSWTRAAAGESLCAETLLCNGHAGASAAQNTTVQRFEVLPSGTLIIRDTLPVDGGQYLCTVQNQHGADVMAVSLVVLSQHPRVLHPRHRDVTVDVGGEVSLECRAEGHPVPRVTWLLPNHARVAAASAAAPQHIVVRNNGTLRIQQASSTDSGIYKCTASSAAGADSVSVRLRVLARPPVIQQPLHESTTLSEGSPAHIPCTATGSPPPVIRWITPDGAQLTASLDAGQNLLVLPNGTLFIRSVGRGDAGRYECSVSAASSRRTVVLSIRKNPSSAKPNISSSSPQRTDVAYGSELLLHCVATGWPKPHIIWRTPSKKLVDAQYSFDSRIKVFPNGSFSLRSATEEDGGDYLCVARNEMGDNYVLLRVHVLTRPARIEQKLQQSSQEVLYGADLKVDCVASGLPSPEISWMLPDGTMVHLGKQTEGAVMARRHRYVVFDNGTLYFSAARRPEEGDYTCYAENKLGRDEMKVRVKIKAAPSLPHIRSQAPQTVRGFHGDTVALQCSATGDPAPVVTWMSPMNAVIAAAPDRYQTLEDGTLIVQRLQRSDGGNYTCVATNSAGQDQKVTRLEVLVTPPVISEGATSSPIKVTAVQNQQKLLPCTAKGSPSPHIVWVLPGNRTLPAPYYSSRMLVHHNGTLEIRSAQETDSGQLVCIARNEGGEDRLELSLEVKTVVERPQTRGSKSTVGSLTVGTAVALSCFSEGSAQRPAAWILPSGASLPSGARLSKFFHQPNGSLVISSPSAADAGVYRCLAHSPGEVRQRTVTLALGAKPEILSRYDAPISVLIGDNLWLHCETTGEALRLAWTLPSGVVLSRVQRAGRYSVLPNGTLAIQHASIYDRGPYTCRASNEHGGSLMSVSVTVIAYPPRITSGPPSVTYAKRGVAVQLNCGATGIPKVQVTWETPDHSRLAVSAQPHLFGNKYLHPQGSLVIQNPTQRDSGIYRCTARNAVGSDSKATLLNVF